MSFENFSIFLKGVGWIALFFLPLIFSKMSSESNDNDEVAFIFFSVVFQVIFMLTIGHSWIR
jgi:hypothetical protein